MEYIPTHVLEPLRKQLIDYCYPYIACMIAVHKDLGRGMPEYLYQEALKICFDEHGYKSHREYPIGILVNFGTWPKAQIQRYYYNKDTGEIQPF